MKDDIEQRTRQVLSIQPAQPLNMEYWEHNEYEEEQMNAKCHGITDSNGWHCVGGCLVSKPHSLQCIKHNQDNHAPQDAIASGVCGDFLQSTVYTGAKGGGKKEAQRQRRREKRAVLAAIPYRTAAEWANGLVVVRETMDGPVHSNMWQIVFAGHALPAGKDKAVVDRHAANLRRTLRKKLRYYGAQEKRALCAVFGQRQKEGRCVFTGQQVRTVKQVTRESIENLWDIAGNDMPTAAAGMLAALFDGLIAQQCPDTVSAYAVFDVMWPAIVKFMQDTVSNALHGYAPLGTVDGNGKPNPSCQVCSSTLICGLHCTSCGASTSPTTHINLDFVKKIAATLCTAADGSWVKTSTDFCSRLVKELQSAYTQGMYAQRATMVAKIETSRANAKQVAGSHYKTSIEHWDYVVANDIPYLEAQAIKYLTRWRKKGGLNDVRKAQHFIEKLLEVETAREQQTLTEEERKQL